MYTCWIYSIYYILHVIYYYIWQFVDDNSGFAPFGFENDPK